MPPLYNPRMPTAHMSANICLALQMPELYLRVLGADDGRQLLHHLRRAVLRQHLGLAQQVRPHDDLPRNMNCMLSITPKL